MAIASPPSTGTDLGPTILPRRDSGLVSLVQRWINRRQRDVGPQPTQRDNSQTGVISQAMSNIWERTFQVSHERMALYVDADTMDRESEEVSVALDTIATNVCTSEDGQQMSFVVQSKDLRVQEILDEATAVASLHQKVRPFVRNLVKYGDAFAEIVVNRDLDLVDFRQLPPHTMNRNQDRKGNLLMGRPKYSPDGLDCQSPPGSCAFEQQGETNQRKLAAAFFPWQLVHGRLNWDGMAAYGTSHLRVTRFAWKKIKALEESMIVGRLTRDLLKLIFYVDTTGLSPKDRDLALARFKNSVTQRPQSDSRRELPFSVMTDFFMTTGTIQVAGQPVEMRSKIDVIDPKNEGLHNITDVEHLHRKLISTLRVPPAHMGYERDLNAKATLTQQDVQYVRWLRDIQQLVGQALEQFYDTALILEGIDPHTVEYRISWPMLKATDELAAAQAEAARAQAMAIYLGHSQQNSLPVVDPMWVQTKVLDMRDDEAKDVGARLDAQHTVERQEMQQDAQAEHARTMEAGAQQAKMSKTANRSVVNENGKGKANGTANLLMQELAAAEVHYHYHLSDQGTAKFLRDNEAVIATVDSGA